MGSKADMLLGFVELFDRPIEGRVHAVYRIASVLHKTNAWFVLPNVGQVDCLAFALLLLFLAKLVRLASVIVMLLLRNRSSFLCSCHSICCRCCLRAILHWQKCLLGSNMMVLSSVF